MENPTEQQTQKNRYNTRYIKTHSISSEMNTKSLLDVNAQQPNSPPRFFPLTYSNVGTTTFAPVCPSAQETN